jgi:rhomboid protease GluP
MNIKEAYLFWCLANTLINSFGYRIIQLFENQQELWLEKLENRNAPIIRMLLHNLDWSNAMQRDIEFTAANGERVRKQLNRNEIHMINIYISEFPPVDEYEYRLAKPYVYPDGNKTTVSSYLLAKDDYDTELRRLSDRLQKEIPLPIYDGKTEQEVELLKRDTLEQAMNQVKAERAVLNHSKPLFTYVFIAINVAVFLWEQLNGGSTNTATLVKYGAKVNELIYEGEWWRFITPIFLHIGFMHLAMNTLALYYLGITVEQIYGNIRFPFIYLFAGVAGVIASFLFSSNLSAGASGAIYGCFGALLYFGAIYPKLFFRTMGVNLFVVLGINLIFSFSASGIDSAGHIGGLIGGFLAAGMVHFPKKKKPVLQILFLIGSVALIWGSLTFGFSSQ